MDRPMDRLPVRPNSRGAEPHPHRAWAWPACCSAGAPGPAMQRGGGSKLKGVTRDAPVLHSHAVNRDVTPASARDTPSHLCAWLCG